MINDTNANNTPSSTKTNTASAENKSYTPNPGRGGLANLASRLHLGNQRSQQQNTARNVFEALYAIVNNGSYQAGELDLLLLDNSISNVALSGIVFALAVPESKVILTSLVLVEGSETKNIKPIKTEGRADGRELTVIELERPATDLYDAETSAAVKELVYGTLTNTAYDIIDVGATIIPKEITHGKTVAELTSSEAMANTLFFIVNSIQTAMIDVTDNRDRMFSVSWATEDRSARIRANIDLNPAPEFTAALLPIRADVAITIGASTNDNGNSSKFNVSTDISKALGYLDLVYVDKTVAAAALQGESGRFVDPNTITQMYAPRFIITRLDTLIPLVTPELSLLALASTLAMSKGNAWMGLLKPKYGIRNSRDLRDAGAIGFEATHLTDGNVSARIDIKSDDFNSNPGNLVDFITTVMHTNLTYSQDIVECSDLGSIDSLFLAAAIGNPGAIDKVFRHCDNLTDNRFSTMFSRTEAIATYSNTLIPIGYYYDQEGVQRDLRTYDYLAILNTYGETDLPLVEKFANATERNDSDSYYRASVIKDILVNTLGSSVVIKAFAHRIDWNANFLTTLARAISDAGFTVESNSVGAYSATTNRRGNVAALNNAVHYQGGSSFYTSGLNGQRVGGVARGQIYAPYNSRQ